jgi:lipopolysaccharide export system protein LptA
MKLTGNRRYYLLFFIAFVLLSSVFAKTKAQNDNQNFRLIHSDKLFLSKFNEENILELFGAVHFFYGNTEFRSNKALIFEKQKIARLMGNVKVNNDTLDVFADSISYYRIPDVLNLTGNVTITEQKKEGVFNQFTCNYGTYDKARDIVTAKDNVKAYSLKENARAECNNAFWDRKNGYGYLLDNPELWSEGKDTLYVRSEKMEFFDADNKVIATFDVTAQSKEYKATSDFLLYFLKEDKAIFQGEPHFTSNYADAVAEEFYLYFTDRKLNSAELKDSCLIYFAGNKDKPKHNWVKADFIRLNLKDDYLKDFVAEENVTYYYLQEKDGKEDFFSNNAVGTHLTALFKDDGRLDKMLMKKKVKGIYRFENNP